MKSKWWWLVGGIALLVAVAFAVRIWFIMPGIHVFGNEIHIDITYPCYIIDGVSGELLMKPRFP